MRLFAKSVKLQDVPLEITASTALIATIPSLVTLSALLAFLR
jgi:hypothetical protein